MTHEDHVQLIKKGIEVGGTWADLGSGEGAFTLALADVAGPEAEIYSADKNKQSLEVQKSRFHKHFPDRRVHYFHQDFTRLLELPALDGILMANSLHFIQNQQSFLSSVKNYLKPSGKLVLVEYNADRGNMWVPYPVSFIAFTHLAGEAGFENPSLLSTIPSVFLNEIYSAICSF